MCEFEVFTTNTLGEIGVRFSTSERRLKKKLIQLKVFKENNSLGGLAQTNYVVSQISALSDRCMGMQTIFIAYMDNYSEKVINNHHDFVYKGDSYWTLREYKSCPVECRNFTYNVFVMSINDKAVLEYRSPVGY